MLFANQKRRKAIRGARRTRATKIARLEVRTVFGVRSDAATVCGVLILVALAGTGPGALFEDFRVSLADFLGAEASLEKPPKSFDFAENQMLYR
jgi:hypothetical protein